MVLFFLTSSVAPPAVPLYIYGRHTFRAIHHFKSKDITVVWMNTLFSCTWLILICRRGWCCGQVGCTQKCNPVLSSSIHGGGTFNFWCFHFRYSAWADIVYWESIAHETGKTPLQPCTVTYIWHFMTCSDKIKAKRISLRHAEIWGIKNIIWICILCFSRIAYFGDF